MSYELCGPVNGWVNDWRFDRRMNAFTLFQISNWKWWIVCVCASALTCRTRTSSVHISQCVSGRTTQKNECRTHYSGTKRKSERVIEKEKHWRRRRERERERAKAFANISCFDSFNSFIILSTNDYVKIGNFERKFRMILSYFCWFHLANLIRPQSLAVLYERYAHIWWLCVFNFMSLYNSHYSRDI